MIISTILFYIFAIVLVVSAFVVVSVKNPVHSVLFLVLAFFNAAGLFVLLGAEFLAMLLVIVYVGAVMVLFLFVIMTLNITAEEKREICAKNLSLGFLVGMALLMEMFLMVKITLLSEYEVANSIFAFNGGRESNVAALGDVLYTDFVYQFQLSGVILLVAMIGAITLTLKSSSNVKHQNIFKQTSRSVAESVKLVKVKSGDGVNV